MSAHVTVRLADNFRTLNHARGHRFAADLPGADGGDDAAPTPEELLLAALGSCTAETLRLYARRKGWPLEGVEVVLDHAHVVVEGAAPSDTGTRRRDRITRHVAVHGPLTDEQVGRLLDIANRCPVHRILANGPEIVTRIVAEPAVGEIRTAR